MSFTTFGARPPEVRLVAAAVALVSLGAAEADRAEEAAAANGDAANPEERMRIRFNSQGATFEHVIDFFSRATGLPVVREADVPEPTLDYLPPEAHTLDEALEILNIIPHAKGVTLCVSDDMLYLQKLEERQSQCLPPDLTPSLQAMTGEPLTGELADDRQCESCRAALPDGH